MQYTLVYSILIKMSVDIQQFNFMAHDLENTAADSGPVVQDRAASILTGVSFLDLLL